MNILRYIKYIIAFYLFLCISLTSSAKTDAFDDVKVNECIELNRNRKYNEAKVKAATLIEIGKKSDNQEIELIGTALYILSSVSQGNDSDYSKQIDFLKQGLSTMDEKHSDYNVLSIIHKAIAIYYHLIEQDFSQSAGHNFKALEYIRKVNDPRGEVDILCNLSSLYFQKNDSTGITYSTEAYAKSKELKYFPGLYRTSANVSNYYFNQKQYEKSMNYLQEAMQLAKDLNYDNEMQYLHSFLGDVYSALNDPVKAEENYKISIIDKPGTTKYDRLYARICYGMFLNKQQRYDEALKIFHQIEQLSQEWNLSIFDKEIAQQISFAYEMIGQYENALKYYKLFDSIKELQLNIEKEKEFSILDLKYKVSEEKQKNTQKELEIIRSNRIQIILFFAIGLIVVITIFIFVLYKRAQKRNKEIVRTHIDNLENEHRLRQQLQPDSDNSQLQESGKKENGKYDRSSLSEKKSLDLFNQLEQIMKNDKTYHDAELSIDKLAAMLNTNRSYLSQVINEQTGISYSTYINNLRIKEAIELLSDPANDEPVKTISFSIGFNSPSNFYTIFKNKVGISPSAYRESVQKLSKSHQKTTISDSKS